MVIHTWSCALNFKLPESGGAFAWGAGEVFIVRQIPCASEFAGFVDLFPSNCLGIVIDLVTDHDGFSFLPSFPFSNLIRFLDTPKV